MELSERLKDPIHTNSELEILYKDADMVDREPFAEMRSNVLLIAGDHYNKNRLKLFNQIRTNRDIPDEMKVRLTNNHIQKAHKIYYTNIMGTNPQVACRPKNETEEQDQKAAELHQAVWRNAIERYNLLEAREDWCDSFLGIGEVCVVQRYDPVGGGIKGYEQKVDDKGQPVVDAQGQPVPDMTLPVMRGAFIFEEVFGFNLLRAPETKNMKDSPYFIIRKMVNVEELKKKFPTKKAMIKSSMDETFVVFDGNQRNFKTSENEVMLLEYYFRPSRVFPNGYYYCKIKDGILFQDELPGGVWPIAWRPMDKAPTAPRGISYVKTARPFQAEINRAVSKIAEHQMTLGDDKLLIQMGTKVQAGVSLPGVRTITHNGAKPDILAGRDGSQYVNHLASQIEQMDKALFLDQLLLEPNKGTEDPFTSLFRAASAKRVFSRYTTRFESFLKEICEIHLKLSKYHLEEDEIITAVGRNEIVNISEFKNSHDLRVEITIEPQSDDLETKMGRQLAINQAMQYGGDKLTRDDFGMLLAEMPFANLKRSLGSLTLDYEVGRNLILALDRGQVPPPNKYDDHVGIIKRLVARMRQADFPMLPQQIQASYMQRVKIHEDAEVQRQKEIQAAQADFIPTDGPLVIVDFYVRDPVDPRKTQRARLPHSALQWLISRLEEQGSSLQQLEDMNHGALQEMAGILQQQAVGAPNGMRTPPAIPQGAGSYGQGVNGNSFQRIAGGAGSF